MIIFLIFSKSNWYASYSYNTHIVSLRYEINCSTQCSLNVSLQYASYLSGPNTVSLRYESSRTVFLARYDSYFWRKKTRYESYRNEYFWVFWQPKSGLKNAGSSTNRTSTVRIVLPKYERTATVRIVSLRYAAYCGGMIRTDVWVFWQPKSGAEKHWIKYASYCYGTYRTAPVRTYCHSMHRIVTIRSVLWQYDSYRC